MKTSSCLNISQIQEGKQYRYKGFYNGEGHDEIVTIININRKKRQEGTITMSNGISTLIEANGSVYCLTKQS